MASIGEILAALQNGVAAINNLSDQIATTFPQASAVSTSAATAGAITFTSSLAAGFLTVITSSGATYKVPLFT